MTYTGTVTNQEIIDMLNKGIWKPPYMAGKAMWVDDGDGILIPTSLRSSDGRRIDIRCHMRSVYRFRCKTVVRQGDGKYERPGVGIDADLSDMPVVSQRNRVRDIIRDCINNTDAAGRSLA